MKYMLVTGAASGIGEATAKRFAAEGWRLGLLDINEPALKTLNEALGGEHWVRALDVRDEQATRDALAAFSEFSGGKLDLLFNSAGVLRTGLFETISLADHRLIMEINTIGLLQMSYQAFPLLKATPGSRVINMSSASALYGTPHFASYSASKLAVRGLTEALNIEWARHGIIVQDMMPPFVKTPMLDAQHANTPMVERLGVELVAEDIAEAVWQAARGRRVHNPISLQFKALMTVSALLPARVTRTLLSFLSR